MCCKHHCRHVFTNIVSDTNHIRFGQLLSLGLWTFAAFTLPIPHCQIKGHERLARSYVLVLIPLLSHTFTMNTCKQKCTNHMPKKNCIRNCDTQIEIDERTGKFTMPSWYCSFQDQVTLKIGFIAESLVRVLLPRGAQYTIIEYIKLPSIGLYKRFNRTGWQKRN